MQAKRFFINVVLFAAGLALALVGDRLPSALAIAASIVVLCYFGWRVTE